MKITLSDKAGNAESLKKQSQQFESFSSNVPIIGKDLLRTFYNFFYFLFYDITCLVKKHCVVKVLPAIWEITDMKMIATIIPTDSYKFVFILFLLLLTNQKQESVFQHVDCLVKTKISVFFIASRALLQSYAEFNRTL